MQINNPSINNDIFSFNIKKVVSYLFMVGLLVLILSCSASSTDASDGNSPDTNPNPTTNPTSLTHEQFIQKYNMTISSLIQNGKTLNDFFLNPDFSLTEAGKEIKDTTGLDYFGTFGNETHFVSSQYGSDVSIILDSKKEADFNFYDSSGDLVLRKIETPYTNGTIECDGSKLKRTFPAPKKDNTISEYMNGLRQLIQEPAICDDLLISESGQSGIVQTGNFGLLWNQPPKVILNKDSPVGMMTKESKAYDEISAHTAIFSRSINLPPANSPIRVSHVLQRLEQQSVPKLITLSLLITTANLLNISPSTPSSQKFRYE